MPPVLAFALTLVFIAYLYWRDIREKPRITLALWLPILWMMTSGSRPLSRWIVWGEPGVNVAMVADGSSVDRNFYSMLIAIGLFVLVKRRVRLWSFIKANKWLTLYFAYCFAAIFWSEYPLVAVKRWVKCIGEPVMVLVLMTEPMPMEALSRLMKRCAYLLLPLSITYIKYFPDRGRSYNVFNGIGEMNGVALDKNGLGYLCMVLGTFFFVHLMRTRKQDQSPERRSELILTSGILVMVMWLMIQAKSSTALMGLIIAVATVVVLGMPVVSRRYVGIYVSAAFAVLAIAEFGFGLSAGIIALLGEDSTLTGRTELWEQLIPMTVNPLIGAGFESFWLGDRLEQIWAKHWWRPTQAHNGYLETYLNLGGVGLFLIVGLIVVVFRKGTRELLRDFDFGRYRVAMLFAIVAYNWTEAAYKTLHLVFFVLYIVAIDNIQPAAAESQQPAKPLDKDRAQTPEDPRSRVVPWAARRSERWRAVGQGTPAARPAVQGRPFNWARPSRKV